MDGDTVADVIINSAALKSSTYAGISELWQDLGAAGAADQFTVAADVTAGLKSTNDFNTAVVGTTTVNAASATQASLKIALDGIGDNTNVTITGAGVKTLNVSGTVAKESASADGDLTLTGTTAVTTANLSFSSNVDLTLATMTGLTTFAAGSSTGDMEVALDVGAGALTKLTAATLGSGSDKLTLTVGDKATVVDMGAGNDEVVLASSITAAALPTITLGAGKDKLTVTPANLDNILDVTNDASILASVIEVKDFKTAEDILNLGGKGHVLDGSELASIAAKTTLKAALQEAGTYMGAAGEAVVFSWGGNAYVYVDDSDAGASGKVLDAGDGLIQLTGVVATEFTNIQNGNLVL